jgi:hypothetical protein
MKRKRQEQEEDETIGKLKEEFKEINRKIKSYKTSRGKEIMKQELRSHESFIKIELICAIKENRPNVIKSIFEEYPTHVPSDILFLFPNIDLDMVDYLFEKKLVSLTKINTDGDDIFMVWVKQKNLKLVEYLVRVQKFNLTSKFKYDDHTGFLNL